MLKNSCFIKVLYVNSSDHLWPTEICVIIMCFCHGSDFRNARKVGWPSIPNRDPKRFFAKLWSVWVPAISQRLTSQPRRVWNQGFWWFWAHWSEKKHEKTYFNRSAGWLTMDTTREFSRVPEFHPCSKPQKWKALQGVDFQKFVSFTGEFWCPRKIRPVNIRECESNVMCPMVLWGPQNSNVLQWNCRA